MKTCIKCHVDKQLSEFHKHSKNKDGLQAYCKKCSSESSRGSSKRHYDANRKKYAEYNKLYKSSPKGRAINALSKTRTDRRRVEAQLGIAIKDTLTSHQVAMIQAESRCQYCGHPMEFGQITVDHVVPFRNGGTNEYTNLIPCCKGCNSRKGTKSVLTFLSEHSTPLQTRRVIDRLAQRRGIDYVDMHELLLVEQTAVTSDA
jgi:5-methylcytosine-specific restriction endonuclease McrA